VTPAGRADAARGGAPAGSPPGVWDLVVVAAVRAAAVAVVWACGFRAISDDDYSRVVIAQGFAAVPALDPSGTSWLPLPFWLTGAAMLVAGPSLAVARAVSLLTAVGSALLVHAAARALGLDRRAALLAGVLGAALPYAARLGVATIPDGYAAALITYAAASTAHERGRERLAGALCITAATLCRYEAWPVALVVAVCAGLDARAAIRLIAATNQAPRAPNREQISPEAPLETHPRPARVRFQRSRCCWQPDRCSARRRAPWLAASALLALSGPAAWLAHGALAHGDPLFFVGRVTAYRAALGATATAPLTALAALLVALPRYEPELAALALLALLGRRVARAPLRAGRYLRFAAALGALLTFVAAGEWRNAAPTHHGERALLALWLGLAIVTGDGLARAWQGGGARARWRLAGAAALLVGLAAGAWRPRWGRPAPFVDRRHEVGVGAAARRLLPAGERLAIDTPDYGFFAVMAAFGRAGAATALDDRDPRHPRPPDALRSPAALDARLRAVGARWVVTAADRKSLAGVGVERARDGALALYELTSAR